MLTSMIFWARPRFEWHLRTRTVTLGESTRLVAVVSMAQEAIAGGRRGLHRAAWAKMAVAQAVEAVDAGADVVELTADPRGNLPPTVEAEMAQMMPVLEGLMMERPDAVVCVEVHHAQTAHAAILAGAEIVNDPCGPVWNDALAKVAVQTGCGFVLRATFQAGRPPGPLRGHEGMWAKDARATQDEVVPVVFTGMCEQLMLAEEAGIDAEQIVADPGYGVGRSGVGEFALLAGLGRLRQLDRPLVMGMPAETRPGSGAGLSSASRAAEMAANVAAVLAGAHLLRVHDVVAGREAADVADAVLAASSQ